MPSGHAMPTGYWEGEFETSGWEMEWSAWDSEQEHSMLQHFVVNPFSFPMQGYVKGEQKALIELSLPLCSRTSLSPKQEQLAQIIQRFFLCTSSKPKKSEITSSMQPESCSLHSQQQSRNSHETLLWVVSSELLDIILQPAQSGL